MPGRTLARTLAALIVVDALLIAFAVARYPDLWAEGDRLYLLYPAVAFVLYGLAALTIARARGPATPTAFGAALWFGIAGGAVSALHLPLEDVPAFSPALQHTVDIVLFLALFACFVAPAARTTADTKSVAAGIAAAVCCALVAMLLTVAVGFAYNFASIEHHEAILRGAFAHGSMHNAAAFTFENSLDAAGTHLLEGPFIAAILGALGAATTAFLARGTNSGS
jgi:hypothetical protein